MFADHRAAPAYIPGFITWFQFSFLTQSLFQMLTERKKVSMAIAYTKPQGNFHLECISALLPRRTQGAFQTHAQFCMIKTFQRTMLS